MEQQREVVRKAVAEAVEKGRLTLPQSAGGDPAKLRGLPAVGVRGASGAIRGTQPEAEAIRRSMQK